MLVRVAAGAVAGLLAVAAAYQLGRSSAASTEAARPMGDQTTAADPGHELGRRIYNFRCYFCHGYSGDARTLAATFLNPAPRDFSAAEPADLPASAVLAAVRDGRAGTAMKSFRGILDEAEMKAVAEFVTREFVERKAPNTAYHTAENGWPEHQRFAQAFPFARGELALDTPVEQLDAAQRQGRALFLGSCVTCHDRARVSDEGPAWSSRPVSYPRMGFVPGQPNTPPPDVVSSASVYAKHEVAPKVAGLSAQERQGEALFQSNCAFCHGADGTGKNWIGQFMEPKARDLTQYDRQTMPPARLKQVIREGLPDTSMPAWQHVLDASQIDALSAYVARVIFKPSS